MFSPSVYVDVALQKQLEELLNSCYYIPSKEEASKVEVMMKLLIVLMPKSRLSDPFFFGDFWSFMGSGAEFT